jgi:hypothetical protein
MTKVPKINLQFSINPNGQLSVVKNMYLAFCNGQQTTNNGLLLKMRILLPEYGISK